MKAGIKLISLDFSEEPDVHLKLSHFGQAQRMVPYCKTFAWCMQDASGRPFVREMQLTDE